jgi:hypothetical protein
VSLTLIQKVLLAWLDFGARAGFHFHEGPVSTVPDEQINGLAEDHDQRAAVPELAHDH